MGRRGLPRLAGFDSKPEFADIQRNWLRSSCILEIAYAESGIQINQVANLTKKVILPLEKQTPHCRLGVVKALVTSGKIRATASAYRGALELGISDIEGIAEVVLSLTTRDFHKSMTTHLDHQIWQSVDIRQEAVDKIGRASCRERV